MEHDRRWLEAEIAKRAPWYQRIEFPEYGITTTDNPGWYLHDSACDNLFPGITASDAPRLRPIPKYERVKQYLPDVAGKTVLDVGCSCGFFCFEFAKLGATAVTGLDIDATNAERGNFCSTVFGTPHVQFVFGDLGQYKVAHDIVWGASLHEHFFFPFYYLTRLLCLANSMLILETHEYLQDDALSLARLDRTPGIADKTGNHAFHFSRRLFTDYLDMLWIPPSAIEERVFYDDTVVRRLLLCVDTSEFQRTRREHGYLRIMDEIK